MNKVYSKIESINGSVITVRADDVKYGELAEITTSFGTSLAEVNRINGNLVSLQVFAGGRGVSTGDQVRFLGHEMQVSFSENLLGRIFNGSGEPRDKGPGLKEFGNFIDHYCILIASWHFSTSSCSSGVFEKRVA